MGHFIGGRDPYLHEALPEEAFPNQLQKTDYKVVKIKFENGEPFEWIDYDAY